MKTLIEYTHAYYSTLAGSEFKGYNSKRSAPFRLMAEYATFALKSRGEGMKWTDRVRRNKEFSTLVRCEPAAGPLLLLLWLLWSDAIKDL